ncbi:MAG: Uma2 family endonuclease [bacterium]
MSVDLATTPRRILTYQDYLQLPEDTKRYEIIEGELYMSPAPNVRHQIIITNLLGMIWSFLQDHPIGRIFPAPTDVLLSDVDILQPDLVFLSNEKFDRLTRANIQGAPDLVVEVFSPGTEKRDRTLKLKKYSEFGVGEYWMVSEENATLEVWRRQEDKLVFHSLLEGQQALTTPLMPGLEILLQKLF